MSPRRWSNSTRNIIISFIVERDGRRCAICAKIEAQLEHPLELDHVDPAGPDTAENLRLLCKACNIERRHPRGPNLYRGTKERERNNVHAAGEVRHQSPTFQAKTALPYAEGCAEMQASSWFEISYRTWIQEQVPLPRSEAINGGAETVGCSPETAARYLAKLTSIAGPLTQDQDIHGVTTISKKESFP